MIDEPSACLSPVSNVVESWPDPASGAHPRASECSTHFSFLILEQEPPHKCAGEHALQIEIELPILPAIPQPE